MSPLPNGDDTEPMTRTELAMLWDGLGRWMASHPRPTLEKLEALTLRDTIDVELVERFGG